MFNGNMKLTQSSQKRAKQANGIYYVFVVHTYFKEKIVTILQISPFGTT
jgi:hypothetical protein